MNAGLQAARGAGEQLPLSFDSPESIMPPREHTGDRIRRVVADHEVIAYRLQRVRRRSIGLHVDETGLTIRAPRWIALHEIEAAIVENLRWIRRKQHEWLDRHPRQRVAEVVGDGGSLQYLGGAVTLRLGADRLLFDQAAALLALAVPLQATPSEVREALHGWLQQQARGVFAERIARFGGCIDACPSRLQAGARFAGWRLSSARTQWGSCSQDGRIRLNWRLVHFPLPVIDYVIAHELAHLTELNHSARFWSTVAELLPGFEAARDQIKRIDLDSFI